MRIYFFITDLCLCALRDNRDIQIAPTEIGHFSSLNDELLRRAVAVEAGHPCDVDRSRRNPFDTRCHDVDRRERQLDHTETSGSRLIAAGRYHGARVLAHVGSSNGNDLQSAVVPHFHPLTRLRIYHSDITITNQSYIFVIFIGKV